MIENNGSIDAMIQNIVTVVFRIHFYYINNYDLEQDLKQEGYLKAYELLSSGNYDPYRNLRTFIYTGVRNAMTNYLYHNKKESHSSTEELTETQAWQAYEKVALDGYWKGKIFCDNEDFDYNSNVDIMAIREICDKYIMFGDYFWSILKYLSDLGLYSGHVEKSELKEIAIIKDAIIGEVIWNIIKNI